VVSGPAQLTGNTLHFTGDGTVTLTATQAGDGSDAPLSATETITVAPPEAPGTDTPTLTQWALIAMGVLLALSASRSLGPVARPSA
jgi:hypothetical protein